jgi:hypothetical protein
MRGDRPNQEHDAQECDPLKLPVRGQLSPFPLGKRFNWYNPGLTDAYDSSLPLQSAFQLIHMRTGVLVRIFEPQSSSEPGCDMPLPVSGEID